MTTTGTTPAGTIQENLRSVREKAAKAAARAGRSPESVKLISVVKKRPLEQVRELHSLGERFFAENRIQEARDRIPQLPGGIEWHFIGHLQTNKAKYLPGLAQWVHSVDRFSVAEALEKAYASRSGDPVNVLLQLNVSGEEQKYGADPSDAKALLAACLQLPSLKVRGVMCMAPHSEDPEPARPVFRELRALRDELAENAGVELPELSMGMTNDFEVAIEEGSTMIRVGSGLFE